MDTTISGPLRTYFNMQNKLFTGSLKRNISLLFLCFSLLPASFVNAQPGWWQSALKREDGKKIVFRFEWRTEKGKPAWYIHNASETIRVADITMTGDSMIVQMPVFESQFRLIHHQGELEGLWIKGGAVRTQVMAFTAGPVTTPYNKTKPVTGNISGRWSAIFTSGTTTDTAVAEFIQKNSHVSGTFLTNTGDYRYLEGNIAHDSLFLSCFDGGHAFSFTARIANNKKLAGGWFYSGAKFKQEWSAIKDAKAKVPEESSAMYLRPGEERLDFTFNGLDSKPVSINDERFKNKVVIVQIMGSWCPNCMDETAFLSEYYEKNRQRGVEVIALAYEYSTDIERSRKSLQKFQQRFNVQYPMLLTGVSVNDSLRTEKTLPQVTPIRFFPSSIIIDKKGRVRKFDTSFNGPGTGEHFFVYKKEFESTIDGLLKEN